jgi:hypothetical protein
MQAEKQITSEAFDAAEQALYAHQAELEKLYDKNKLIPRLRREFLAAGVAEYLERYEIPAPFGFDLLAQMELHKRCDVSTMVGLLRRHLGDSQETADMIRKCVVLDLVDYDIDKLQLVVKHEVTADVRAELERFQYPLPMVVPPRKLRGNKDTGYLTGERSVVLRDNHTNQDLCLDHLNRANSVAFEINEDVALMVKNQWKGLDKQKSDETWDDFQRRKKAFAKFDRTAKDVMNKLTQLSTRHYLTHRYDFRGRTYCQGYHVNYQGNDWNKAIIQLADKEVVPT